MSDCSKPMTIGQLQKLIAGLVMVPQTRDIWVVAETMDVAVRGGHCYMEQSPRYYMGVGLLLSLP